MTTKQRKLGVNQQRLMDDVIKYFAENPHKTEYIPSGEPAIQNAAYSLEKRGILNIRKTDCLVTGKCLFVSLPK